MSHECHRPDSTQHIIFKPGHFVKCFIIEKEMESFYSSYFANKFTVYLETSAAHVLKLSFIFLINELMN